MKIVAVDEASSEIEQLRNLRPVVFAGSGVSIWKPTFLPSGAKVTSSLWDILFEGLSCSHEEKSFLDSLVWEFPFEHLFEVCPNKDKARELLIRLYDCSIANPVHLSLVDAIYRGYVSSVITTNYDKCFEAAFASIPALSYRKVTTEDEAAEGLTSLSDIFLFKVHGSADNGSQNLIYTLQGEGLLPPAKRKLLMELMSNATCLFIGYSGLDFDLCPLVSEFDGINVFWIGLEDTPKTVNANRLLERVDGTYIHGDMLEVIHSWLGSDLEAEIGYKDVTAAELRASFTEEEIATWRVAVLNALGLPNLALRALAATESTFSETDSLINKSRSLFYQGKYLQSSRSYIQLAYLEAKRTLPERASSAWLDASDSYRAGGYFLRSLICLIRGRVSSKKYDRSKYLLKKAFLLSNILVLMELLLLPQGMVKKFIKSRLENTLIECMELAIKAGGLMNFQDVGHTAEKHSLLLDRREEGIFLPAHPKDGYKHLGYYHAEAMTLCDDCLNTKDISLMPVEELDMLLQEIDKHILLCQLTGQNPNTWKLQACKKFFLRESGREEFKDLETLEDAFSLCEYSNLMGRLQQRRFRL